MQTFRGRETLSSPRALGTLRSSIPGPASWAALPRGGRAGLLALSLQLPYAGLCCLSTSFWPHRSHLGLCPVQR